MNKILVPKITLKEIVSDEERIKVAYARIFNIARRNILVKKHLTNGMTHKYTEVQYGKGISNNRRSSKEVAS